MSDEEQRKMLTEKYGKQVSDGQRSLEWLATKMLSYLTQQCF